MDRNSDLEDGVQSTRRINEIAYEDGKFVIIGDGGKIYTSDGTQITVQNSNLIQVLI